MEPSMSNGGGEVKKEDDNKEVSVKDQEASSSCKRRFKSVVDSIGSGVAVGEGSGGGGGGGSGDDGDGDDGDDGGVESMPVNPEGRAISRPKSRPAPDTSLLVSQCFVTTEFVKVGTNAQSDQIKRVIDTVDGTYPTVMDDEEKISKVETVTARMPVAKDADKYFMHHKNRGKCVIFNHEGFADFDKREGSTVDAKNLQKSFSNLGFDVEVHDNLIYKEVMEVLEELSTKTDHSDSDCICIIVLTHGVHNDLIFAKDAFYRVHRLWKPFTGDNCPTLAGKPKLFFVQASRADKIDNGVVLLARSQSSVSTDSVSSSYKIPTHADILIVHSSAPGYYSWTDPEEGAWYVNSLCSILDKYGTELDLLTMLTMTARKVATEYESYNRQDATWHRKKQVPSIMSMLIRSVYFPPKTNV